MATGDSLSMTTIKFSVGYRKGTYTGSTDIKCISLNTNVYFRGGTSETSRNSSENY
jgi:hypothetical protein